MHTAGTSSLPGLAGTLISRFSTSSLTSSKPWSAAHWVMNAMIFPSFFEGRGTWVICSNQPHMILGSRPANASLISNTSLIDRAVRIARRARTNKSFKGG